MERGVGNSHSEVSRESNRRAQALWACFPCVRKHPVTVASRCDRVMMSVALNSRTEDAGARPLAGERPECAAEPWRALELSEAEGARAYGVHLQTHRRYEHGQLPRRNVAD